jgi:hypothetical protein
VAQPSGERYRCLDTSFAVELLNAVELVEGLVREPRDLPDAVEQDHWIAEVGVEETAKQIRRASDLQATDPSAAADTWAQVDRKVVDLALWCPLVNEGSDFVSARLQNYEYSLAYGVLLDQAWVE